MPTSSRTALLVLLAVLVGVVILLLATRLPLYLRLQTAPTVPSTLTKQFTWTPSTSVPPGTYVAHIVAEDDHGGRFTRDVEIVVTGEAPGEAIPGDLNRDGVVNIDDLTLVTSNFGRATADATDARADANRDGFVNIDDLTIVTSNFGRTAQDTASLALKVSATAWTQQFKAAVDPAATRGYPVPAGAEAAKPLPWASLDQLHVQFSPSFTGTPRVSNFTLHGTNQAGYPLSSVQYDSASRTATLTVAAPLGIDRYHLAVTGLLSGEAGVAFAVLPGDTNQDGTVTENDAVLIQSGLGRFIGDASYSVFADLNGSGGVAVNDSAPLRANLGQSLP